ncbi:MAG TPA: hypothetical protein VK934_02245 [Fimbriimonas sp.]|nr:hypothetical protein [Fimbriimonas sp.]
MLGVFRSPLALLVLVMPMAALFLLPKQPQQSADRFLAVKKWKLTMTWSAGAKRHEIKDGDHSETYDLSVFSGSLKATLQDEDPPLATPPFGEWRSEKGTGDVIQRYKQVIKDKDTSNSMEISTKGMTSCTADFNIDAQSQTYKITASAMTEDGKITISADGSKNEAPMPLVLMYPTGAVKEFPLPKNGMNISGGDSYTYPVVAFNGSGPGFDVVTVNVHWELAPEGQEDGEVFVSDIDKSWLPETDKKVRITVKCEKGSMSEIKYTLYDVSTYKGDDGVEGTSLGPDLAFDKNSGYKITQQGAKEWLATNTTAYDRTAAIDIIASDTAASGKVKVEAKVNGKWVKAKLRNGEEFVQLPHDKNDNDIGDAWEEKEGIFGKNYGPSWDDDELSGNANIGDGLSLFDEYRGVTLRDGTFTRLSPNVQELMVQNQIGQPAASGIDLFTKLTKVRAVDVGFRGLGLGRLAIKNQTSHSNQQYGVRLVKDSCSKYSASTAGVTLPRNAPKTSPKDVTAVVVETILVTQPTHPAWKGTGMQQLAATVAHELGHCVAILHHGDKAPARYPKQFAPGKTPHAFNLKGQDLCDYTLEGAKRPVPATFSLQADDEVGMPEGQSSGDVECLMAYTGLYDWCYILGTSSQAETMLQAPGFRSPTRICTSNLGTGSNAGGKLFGNALRGKCLNQIKVKD